MKFKPGIYQHYKGNKYLVLSVVKHTETLEDMVLYITLYENEMSKMWVRPLEMFLEEIEFEGRKMPRFTFISER